MVFREWTASFMSEKIPMLLGHVSLEISETDENIDLLIIEFLLKVLGYSLKWIFHSYLEATLKPARLFTNTEMSHLDFYRETWHSSSLYASDNHLFKRVPFVPGPYGRERLLSINLRMIVQLIVCIFGICNIVGFPHVCCTGTWKSTSLWGHVTYPPGKLVRCLEKKMALLASCIWLRQPKLNSGPGAFSFDPINATRRDLKDSVAFGVMEKATEKCNWVNSSPELAIAIHAKTLCICHECQNAIQLYISCITLNIYVYVYP